MIAGLLAGSSLLHVVRRCSPMSRGVKDDVFPFAGSDSCLRLGSHISRFEHGRAWGRQASRKASLGLLSWKRLHCCMKHGRSLAFLAVVPTMRDKRRLVHVDHDRYCRFPPAELPPRSLKRPPQNRLCRPSRRQWYLGTAICWQRLPSSRGLEAPARC